MHRYHAVLVRIFFNRRTYYLSKKSVRSSLLSLMFFGLHEEGNQRDVNVKADGLPIDQNVTVRYLVRGSYV